MDDRAVLERLVEAGKEIQAVLRGELGDCHDADTFSVALTEAQSHLREQPTGGGPPPPGVSFGHKIPRMVEEARCEQPAEEEIRYGRVGKCEKCGRVHQLAVRCEAVDSIWGQPTVCDHGSLKRKCEICQRDEEIAELKAQPTNAVELKGSIAIPATPGGGGQPTGEYKPPSGQPTDAGEEKKRFSSGCGGQQVFNVPARDKDYESRWKSRALRAEEKLEKQIESQVCVSCSSLICPPMQCGACIEAEAPVPAGMPARPATATLRARAKRAEENWRNLKERVEESKKTTSVPVEDAWLRQFTWWMTEIEGREP